MDRHQAADVVKDVVIYRTRPDVPTDVAEAMDVLTQVLGKTAGEHETAALREVAKQAQAYVALEVADDPTIVDPDAALHDLYVALRKLNREPA